MMVAGAGFPNAPMTSPPSTGRTRREFLGTGAATALTGLSAGAAGCLSGLPPLGGPQSYGRVDVPPAADPSYRRWLPAPSALPDDRSRYTFAYGRPSAIAGDEPEEFLGRRAMAKVQLDHLGLGYENYDRFLDTPFGTVIEASFDPATVSDALEASGYGSQGSYRGFDLFARSDVTRRAAVGDGAVVWSSDRVHDAPDVEALVAAAAGVESRYHEASDAFARVSDAVGASRMVVAGPDFGDPTDGAAFGADAFRFVDDAAFQVIKLVFPEGRAPAVGELERAFREEYGLTREADVFDVTVDGRLGSLETKVPLTGDREVTPMVDPPQVTWGVEFDADARTLTVRHEAGDPVDSEYLWYDVGTDAMTGGIEKEPLWAESTRVTPGDSDTVDLSDRPDVTDFSVVLSPDSGCCAFRVIFSAELREASDA